MTRYLFLLALLPGCGLVRAVDQAARDAGQDAALAETNVSVAKAHQGVTANTTAILDIRDRLAETPEEHAEIARLRAENENHIGALTEKLRTAEAVAAEKAQQAQTAEAAIQDADESAWWRIALEVVLAALGVGSVGGLALRWRGLAGRTLKALVDIGAVGLNSTVPLPSHPAPQEEYDAAWSAAEKTRDAIKERYLKINDKYGIQPAVLKALGKEPKEKSG